MIVCCGEALVDLVPDPVPGGGPMNAAVAAARLGAPAAFIGGLSTDEFGDTITAHLEQNGVDLRLAPVMDAPTARAIVEHVPQLRFRFEGDNTADTLLGPVDLAELGNGPHILHGGTLGMFRGRTAESLATLVESAAAQQGLVSLDPNIRPQIIDDRDQWVHFHQRWLGQTAIYKASDEDLSWIWPDRTPESSCEAVLAGSAEVVILTKGGDGLAIYTDHGLVEISSPSVEIVDTVGAGDTIVGATLASLHELGASTAPLLAEIGTNDWRMIGTRAVEAAAITCSRPGANPPYRNEVDW